MLWALVKKASAEIFSGIKHLPFVFAGFVFLDGSNCNGSNSLASRGVLSSLGADPQELIGDVMTGCLHVLNYVK